MSPDDKREQPRMNIGTALMSHWVRIVLVTVVVLAATAAVLVFVPRVYESTARLMLDAGTGSAADTSARVESQEELLKSRDLLLQVVDLQNLRSVPEFTSAGWSPVSALLRLIGLGGEARNLDDVVISNLAERTMVARERDSSVISVTVRAGDADLAARVANAIARAHVEGWAARQAADQAGATTRLAREIEALRGKVSAADAAVASYKLENGFATTPIALPPTDLMSGAAAQIAEVQQRKDSARSRAEVIRGLLATGKPLDGVADIRDSAVISVLLQSKASLETELTQKQTTLLPNHPTIKALKSQISQLAGQIADEAAKIADSLEAEAKLAADQEQRLRDDAANDKAAQDGTTQAAVSLDGLEREARTQRDLLDSYLAKYADLVAANNANGVQQDIRVLSEAAPAREPSSPNYLLIMGSVGLAALALQVLGAVFERAVPVRYDFDHDQQELAAFIAEPDGEMGDDTGDSLERAVGRATSSAARPGQATESALSDLSRAVGEHGIVLLVGVGSGSGEGMVQVVERLLEDAMLAQFSAVLVDAASGITSDVAGLTDLAADVVDYGESLTRVDDNLAEVRWGRLPTLDRRSPRPLTLIEALADIYHLVVVDTGRAGMTSSLPLFAGGAAAVVLVATGDADPAALAAAERDVAALGFTATHVVDLSMARAEVA